jgi:hypothetical protein
MLSLCSDVRQVGILKYLRCEDADYHMHRPVNCRASMGANFRWTTTPMLGRQNSKVLTPTFPRASFQTNAVKENQYILLIIMARPERFELPTAWFAVSLAIQQSLLINMLRCPPATKMSLSECK